MGHRQRRALRPALHHRAPGDGARGRLGAQRRQGRPRRRRAVRHDADRRARQQRRRRDPRARRRLRLLHRHRRPAPVRGDPGRLPHPRRRQERRVELDRPARAPQVVHAQPARPARRGLPRRRHVVLHLGHRPRLRQRPAAADAQRPVQHVERDARARDHQLRDLQPAAGVVRHDGLRQAARRHAAAADAGYIGIRVGRHRAHPRRRPRRSDRHDPLDLREASGDEADPHRRAHRRARNDGGDALRGAGHGGQPRRRSSSSTSRGSTTPSRPSGRPATAAIGW